MKAMRARAVQAQGAAKPKAGASDTKAKIVSALKKKK